MTYYEHVTRHNVNDHYEYIHLSINMISASVMSDRFTLAVVVGEKNMVPRYYTILLIPRKTTGCRNDIFASEAF